jgi:hypothetical protein
MRIILVLVFFLNLIYASAVRDNSTKLIWQDDIKAKKIRKNFYKAKEFCKNLELAGFNDWRLPTKKELATIIDKRRYPTIKKGFRNTVSGYYWTTTQDRDTKLYSWYGYFGNGEFYTYAKSVKRYVRCVRD